MYFRRLCHLIRQMEETEAIVLGGSRAGKLYDETSDYDLYVYCTAVPSVEKRKEILEQCCDRMEIGNHFWELEDDCTLKNGIDIDILYRNLDDFSKCISDVVDKANAYNGYTTCMWHNLLHSRVLYDRNGKYGSLQTRYDIAYPSELKHAIIHNNMRLLTGSLASYDRQIHKAAARNDLLSVNHRIAAYLQSYFDIIFAMNELTHPGEKRMMEYVKANASILPNDFEKNINSLLRHQVKELSLLDVIIKRMNDELMECLKNNDLI